MVKICKKCGIQKPLEDFPFIKIHNIYRGTCKICINKQSCINRIKNIDESRKQSRASSIKHYARNRKCIREKAIKHLIENKNENSIYRREYYSKNAAKERGRSKKFYAKDIEKSRERGRINRAKNIDHARAVKRARYQKVKNNTEFRLKMNLRSRLRHAMKKQNADKLTKIFVLTGCTIKELITYIESQFQKDMNWNNYGFRGWHIDHILPCASFNLTDPEQQKECFHYSNLQPLWAKDNLSKGAKVVSL